MKKNIKSSSLIKIAAVMLSVAALLSLTAAALSLSGQKASADSMQDTQEKPSEAAEPVQDEPSLSDTSFYPRTNALGQSLQTVSTYNFSQSGYGFVYNYDWAVYTYALDYGVYRQADNTLYRLRTCGGGYQPRLYAYAANGADISSAGWVSMYVDSSMLADSSDFSVGFYLYLSNQPYLDDQASSSSAPLFLSDGKTGYYYNVNTGEWKSASAKDGMIAVGDGFTGYISFPLSAFSHVEESGRKYISSCKNASDLFSAGYKYLCRVWTYCNIADAYESHTSILFDDITFSRAGASHTHSYEYSETVGASCRYGGYEVHVCSGCGQKCKQALTAPLGHSLSEFKKASDGTVYRACTACSHIDASGTGEAAASEDKLYTVTFDYGKGGGVHKVKFREGDKISYDDIPKMSYYQEKYKYQFNAWTSDPELITPADPEGVKVTQDLTFYARYLISDYANKYIGAISVLAQNGGPYVWDEGRVVVLGNSNMSLYHGMEDSFASSGISIYNNSVSGSTSYEMIEWFKVLIATYRPKAVVLNVTTNDMAYYNLSEKQIIENMATLYELTRELIPDAYIFFVSGNPLPGRTEYAETILRTNNAMYRFTLENDRCEYIDVYPKVLAHANKYPAGWDTWTHLTQSGAADMFSDIRAAVSAWGTREGISLS